MITVFTESSAYLLDPDTLTATRMRGAGAGQDPAERRPFAVRTLRRDGEPLTLREWPDIQVGAPLVMWLRVREDGMWTRRVTTNVRAVR